MRETASRDDLLSGLLLVAFHLYHLACYGTMTSEDKEQDLQRLRHLLVIPWRLGPGNSRRHRKRLRWLARHVHDSECRPYWDTLPVTAVQGEQVRLLGARLTEAIALLEGDGDAQPHEERLSEYLREMVDLLDALPWRYAPRVRWTDR